MSLSADTLVVVASTIANSHGVSSPVGVEIIVHDILTAVDFRPRSQHLHCTLCLELMKYANDMNSLSLIPSLISRRFNVDVGTFKGARRMFFYHECYRYQILTVRDIDACVRKCMCDESVRTPNLAAFCWFAPEIQKECPREFVRLVGSCRLSKITEFSWFYSNLEFLSRDNWKNHREIATKGSNTHAVARIIEEDDVEKLIELAASPGFNIDEEIPRCVFEKCRVLNHQPTLVHVAAFYGSIQCLKYLLMSGCDLSKQDHNEMRVMGFAIAGGSIEAIRLLEQQSVSFEGSLQFATMYHRYTIFDWLCAAKQQEVTCSAPLSVHYGTVLSQSIYANNLVAFKVCLDMGFPPNADCYFGETPLSAAAQHGHYNIIKALIGIEGIDVNAKPSSDIDSESPLELAVLNGDIHCVELLLSAMGISQASMEAAKALAMRRGYDDIVRLFENLF